MKDILGANPIAIQIPIGAEENFKGYFATKDGKFVFGSSTGKDISLGETGNFNFTSENMSDVL